MKYIEHELNGETYALSCTANAVFTIYEKYGYCMDIVSALHVADNTPEGLKNTCWLYALFAHEGEMQRRIMGEDHRKIPLAADILAFASPRDAISIKSAVLEAIKQGFARSVVPEEDEEIDLVLAEREEVEKKRRAAAGIELPTLLQRLLSYISRLGTPSS